MVLKDFRLPDLLQETNQRFFHESGRRERSLDETTAKWILLTLRVFHFLLIFVICRVVRFFVHFCSCGFASCAFANCGFANCAFANCAFANCAFANQRALHRRWNY